MWNTLAENGDDGAVDQGEGAQPRQKRPTAGALRWAALASSLALPALCLGPPSYVTSPAPRPPPDLGAAVGNVVTTAVRNAEYTLLVDEVRGRRRIEHSNAPPPGPVLVASLLCIPPADAHTHAVTFSLPHTRLPCVCAGAASTGGPAAGTPLGSKRAVFGTDPRTRPSRLPQVLQNRSEERQLLDSLMGDTPVWSLDAGGAGEPGAAPAAPASAPPPWQAPPSAVEQPPAGAADQGLPTSRHHGGGDGLDSPRRGPGRGARRPGARPVSPGGSSLGAAPRRAAPRSPSPVGSTTSRYSAQSLTAAPPSPRSASAQRRAKPTWWVEANKKAQLEGGAAVGSGPAQAGNAARPFAAPLSAAALSARQARLQAGGRATPEPSDGGYDEEEVNPKEQLARLTAIASQLAVRATEATRQAELERVAEEQRAREAAVRAEEQERVAREVEALRLAATRAAQQAAESSAREALNEAVRRQRDAERAASLAAAQASADARMRSAAAASAAAEASRIANQQRVAAEAARAAAAAAAAAAAEEARQRREEQHRRVEAARKAAEEREAVRRAAEEQAWRQLELAEEAAWSIVAAQQGGEGWQPTTGAGQVPDAEATLHAAACRRATEVVARRVAAGELSTHAAVQAALEEATHEAYSELVQQQQQQPQGQRRGSNTPEPGGERYNAYRRREDIEEEEVARARAHAAALARQEAQAQAQRQREEQQEQQEQAQRVEAADQAAVVDAAATAAACEEPVAERHRGVHEEVQAAEAPPPASETAMPLPRVVQVVVAPVHDEAPFAAGGLGDQAAAAEEEDEEERRHREWAAAEEARVAALWAEHDEMESRSAAMRQRRDEEESQRQALLRILAGEDDAEAAAAAAQVLQLPSPPSSPQVLQPGARSQRRDVFGRDDEGEHEAAASAAEPPAPAQPAPAPPAPPAPPVVSVDELVAAAQQAARQSAAAARKAAASMGDPSSTETVNNAYALACTAEHTARELLAGLQLPLPEDCASAPSLSPVIGAAAASVALLACATGCECAAVQLGMLGPRHRGSGAAGLVAAALAMQAACSDAAHQEEYMAVLQQARLRKAVETEARVVAEAAGQVASRTAKHAMARQQQQQQEQQARLRAEALRAHEARERARHAASMRHAAARHVGAGFDARLVDLAAAWAPPAPAPPPAEVPMDEESALARARARVEALLAAEARGVEYEEEAAPAAAHAPPPQQQQQDQQQPLSPPASSVDTPFDWPASPTASAAVLRPMGVRRSTGKGSRGSRSPPPAVVPVEPAWQAAPSHAGSGMDLQAAENRLKALEAAMEAHRLLAADHAIQALPLQARLLVEQTVAGITAAAGNAGEDVEVAHLRRLMPLQAAGVPVPRSMSATMAAANSVGESALQTLAAVRASRRQLTSLP